MTLEAVRVVVQAADDISVEPSGSTLNGDQNQVAAEGSRPPPKGRPNWPFRVSEKGVEKRVDADSGHEWRWFCSQVEVVALTRNADSEEWGRLLVVSDRDRKKHEWAMPMQMLAGDGAAYRERLLSLGLELAPGKSAKQDLHEYISTARPKERVRCVSRIGWHGDIFVLPDATYGGALGERVRLQTLYGGDHAFRVAGSLEDWQEQVGRYCVGNSRLVLAVSAAFAAPLLYLADAEGGGVHLVGPSQTGKTTALRVAGSVWGGGGINGFLKTWRATSNGLEGTAVQHCDMLLCLDEMSQVDARDAGEIAYMLANGVGKSRARVDGSARPSAEWRTLFLSSGEISLASKMLETGLRARAGQEVRLADLPADAGAQMGLFEELHELNRPDALARHLKEETGRFYGTAGRAFLEQLSEADLVGLASILSKRRNSFISEHVPAGASGQVSSVAARFGLIGAAGELAIAMGILPWPEGEADRAAGVCFRAWLKHRGGDGAYEIEAGIARVREFIERYGGRRFEVVHPEGKISGGQVFDRAGFWKLDKDGRQEFYILPSVWRTEVCAGSDHKMVAQAMAERGLLIPSADGRLTRKERLGGPGTQWVYRITPAILDETEVPVVVEIDGDTGDAGDTS